MLPGARQLLARRHHDRRRNSHRRRVFPRNLPHRLPRPLARIRDRPGSGTDRLAERLTTAGRHRIPVSARQCQLAVAPDSYAPGHSVRLAPCGAYRAAAGSDGPSSNEGVRREAAGWDDRSRRRDAGRQRHRSSPLERPSPRRDHPGRRCSARPGDRLPPPGWPAVRLWWRERVARWYRPAAEAVCPERLIGSRSSALGPRLQRQERVRPLALKRLVVLGPPLVLAPDAGHPTRLRPTQVVRVPQAQCLPGDAVPVVLARRARWRSGSRPADALAPPRACPVRPPVGLLFRRWRRRLGRGPKLAQMARPAPPASRQGPWSRSRPRYCSGGGSDQRPGRPMGRQHLPRHLGRCPERLACRPSHGRRQHRPSAPAAQARPDDGARPCRPSYERGRLGRPRSTTSDS